jgi:hypothetical protein
MITINATLDQQLSNLTQQAREERRLFSGAREAERRNITEVYQWWRAARQEPGYLEKQYEQFSDLKRREVVKAGINFDRLLYLVYGLEGLTRDDKFNKIVVLNRIHVEFESNPLAYEHDTTDRLTAWIVSQGGMTVLARGRGIDTDVEDADRDDDDDAISTSSYSSSGLARTEVESSPLVDSALVHVHPHKVVEPEEQRHDNISDKAIADGFGQRANKSQPTLYRLEYSAGKVNVVAESQHGQSYLALDVANLTLASVFTQAYLRRYGDLGSVLAPVLEVLSTQAPVLALRPALERLRERERDKRRLAGARMLVYRARERELVLAPCSDAMGVVTTAKLRAELFEYTDSDLVLSHFARRWVEQQLVMYEQARDYAVDKVENDSDSVLVKLTNSTNAARWSFLDFWKPEPGYAQLVIYKLTDDDQVLAEATLDFMDFQRWVAEHVDTWITGYARHAGRDYNQQVQFQIAAGEFIVRFDYRDSKYTATGEFSLPANVKQAGSGAIRVNSQDFYITLAAMARIASTMPVSIKLYSEHCVVEVCGDIADYKVVIPCVDTYGYRTHTAAERLALYNIDDIASNIDDYKEFDDDMRAEFNTELLDDTVELFKD